MGASRGWDGSSWPIKLDANQKEPAEPFRFASTDFSIGATHRSGMPGERGTTAARVRPRVSQRSIGASNRGVIELINHGKRGREICTERIGSAGHGAACPESTARRAGVRRLGGSIRRDSEARPGRAESPAIKFPAPRRQDPAARRAAGITSF